MSNQRTLMSFFSSSSQPKPAASQSTVLPSTASPVSASGSSGSSGSSGLPPPPPPPPSNRFVPPPGASNGAKHGTTLAPPKQQPQPTLAPITAEQGRTVLEQAGGTVHGDDVVFASPALSRCRIVQPRAAHVPGLASVNAVLLPVRYQDNFYHAVADATRVAGLCNRVVVDDDGRVAGGLVARLETSPFADPADPADPRRLALYIQSLALGSPFRGSGLMAAVLASVLRTVDALNASPLLAGAVIDTLYCHVWTESDDALRWYEANGFRRDAAPLANYYYKLQPNTAWVVRRDVRVSVVDAVKEMQASAKTQTSTSTRPKTASGLSFQNARPETEWNDLPADMVAPADSATGDVPAPPTGTARTSGTTRKKRAYPAAMFQQ